MITITQTPDAVIIEGHANYAPRGQDIVCAAISALWQTLLCSLDVSAEDITERNETELHMENRNLSESAQLLIDSFFIGVEAVAKAYPDYVKVTRHGSP